MKKGEVTPGCWRPVAGGFLLFVAGVTGLGLMVTSWWLS